jgi:hypothetical protein
MKVDATIVHGAPEGCFLPGNGKFEWFQDCEGGPEMVVVPAGTFMMDRRSTRKGAKTTKARSAKSRSQIRSRSAALR